MIKMYLDFSRDMQELLAENSVSIEDILANVEVDHRVTYELLPFQLEETGFRAKDLVPVIIAASSAVVAISFAILQIMHTLQRRPHFVEINEIEEIRDQDGNILLDTEGKPLLKTVKRYEILEPREEDREREIEFRVDLKQGIVLKIRSSERQIVEKGGKEVAD